jgi:hypothetical protein
MKPGHQSDTFNTFALTLSDGIIFTVSSHQCSVTMANNSYASRRYRPPSKSSTTVLYHSVLLVILTATITWVISNVIHNSVLSSSASLGSIDLGSSFIADRRPSSFGYRQQRDSLPKKKLGVQPAEGKPKGHIDYSDYTGPSKVYTKFEHPFPCFKGESILMLTTPAHEGILFQRPMKTGSTTMTGIVLRLAHNRGQKEYGFDKCKHRTNHGTGKAFDYFRRDKTKSFLFSIIREPQARALSQTFHFDISAGENEPTDPFLHKRLYQTYNYLHYYDDLNTRNYTDVKHFNAMQKEMARQQGFDGMHPIREHLAAAAETEESKREYDRVWKQTRKYGNNFTSHNVIADILKDYDLIAIMERMDESLVVLQMLLNLTTKEILYTRARSAGAFSNGYVKKPCFYILPAFQSPGTKELLASDEWQRQIAPDIEFYKAAHKSLDRTIDALGREEVEKRLEDLRAGLKLAARHCEGRVRTMCSAGGAQIKPRNTTCYVFGEGCDHDCIDELDL